MRNLTDLFDHVVELRKFVAEVPVEGHFSQRDKDVLLVQFEEKEIADMQVQLEAVMTQVRELNETAGGLD